MTQGTSTMRAIGSLLGLAVVATCIWAGLEAYEGGEIYEQVLAACEQEGPLLDPARYAEQAVPAVSEPENAAPLYLRIVEAGGARWSPDLVIGPALDVLEGKPLSAWVDGDRLRVNAFVETNGDLLDAFQAAALRPHCRFPVDLSLGAAPAVPDFAAVGLVARLAVAEGCLRLKEGEPRAALDRAVAVLAWSRAQQRLPLPVTAMASRQTLAHAETLLRELSGALALRAAEQRRLDEALAPLAFREALARGLETETVLAHAAGEVYARDLVRRSTELGVVSLVTFWADRAFYLERMRAGIAALRAPWPGPAQARLVPASGVPDRYPLSQRLLRELADEPARAMDADAQTAVARVALALDAFKTDHAYLPVGLDDLVPLYLPDLPTDPATGVPPLYRVSGTAALVYGAGRNAADDGGGGDDVAWYVR